MSGRGKKLLALAKLAMMLKVMRDGHSHGLYMWFASTILSQ